MPRGGPDYMTPSSGVASVQFDGSAIIAGLRGIQSVDGKGRAIFADDFSRGLQSWTINPDGALEPKLTYVAPYVYHGPVSVDMNLDAHPYGNVISRAVGDAQISKCGLEVCLYTGSTVGAWYIYMIHYFADQELVYAKLIYRPSTKKLYILNADNDEQEVYDFTPRGGLVDKFMPVKLVVDMATAKYVRALVGGTEIDLSAYTAQVMTGVTGASYVVGIGSTTEASYGGSTHIGYVIATVDEP